MIYTNEVPVLKAQERSAVTLGKFDGLHRGHQKLIACMKQKKKERVNPLYDESQCKKTTLSDCMGLCPLSDCEPGGFSDSHIFDPSALLYPCNHRNP